MRNAERGQTRSLPKRGAAESTDKAQARQARPPTAPPRECPEGQRAPPGAAPHAPAARGCGPFRCTLPARSDPVLPPATAHTRHPSSRYPHPHHSDTPPGCAHHAGAVRWPLKLTAPSPPENPSPRREAATSTAVAAERGGGAGRGSSARPAHVPRSTLAPSLPLQQARGTRAAAISRKFQRRPPPTTALLPRRVRAARALPSPLSYASSPPRPGPSPQPLASCEAVIPRAHRNECSPHEGPGGGEGRARTRVPRAGGTEQCRNGRCPFPSPTAARAL